jgi:hypothetical protein
MPGCSNVLPGTIILSFLISSMSTNQKSTTLKPVFTRVLLWRHLSAGTSASQASVARRVPPSYSVPRHDVPLFPSHYVARCTHLNSYIVRYISLSPLISRDRGHSTSLLRYNVPLSFCFKSSKVQNSAPLWDIRLSPICIIPNGHK